MHSTLPAAIALILLAAPTAAQQRAVVIDGDTLRVGGRTVRVMGLDAPEMHARCPMERRMAEAASRRMGELVALGVMLDRHGRDRYGRQLAVVRDTAGRNVATIMVGEGLARPYAGGRRSGWCD